MDIKEIFAQNNLLIQTTPYTCGPCTLLNVLRMKGDLSRTEAELAKLCQTKPRKGTTNEAMVKVAQKIGLELIEQKKGGTIADIEKHLDNKAFVVVCYNHAYSTEGHYGIIAQYDDKAFYLNDCSFGMIRIRKKYFKKFWYDSDGVQRWYMALK